MPSSLAPNQPLQASAGSKLHVVVGVPLPRRLNGSVIRLRAALLMPRDCCKLEFIANDISRNMLKGSFIS